MALLTAFTVLPSLAQPAPPNCDITLFKLQQSDKVRLDRYIFFLDLVTQSNYEQMKQSIVTSWDGPYGLFEGDWNKFEEKRTSLRKEMRYESREKYSRDYAVTTLDDNGLEAYKACLQTARPATSLMVYRDAKASSDKLVTFAVSLRREFNLAGRVMVEVYGGKTVLNARSQFVTCEPKDCSADRNGVIHIAIDPASLSEQFTIERQNVRTEMRVTAQIGGLVANPALVVGPQLATTVSEVKIPVMSQGTFVYMARRLIDGRNDWVYRIDNEYGGDGQVSGTFQPHACLCASGQRTPAASWPYQGAGTCIPPSNPTDVRLEDVKPDEFLLKEIDCGANLKQAPMTLHTNGPFAVCYVGNFSLNAPSEWGTYTQCTVKWTLNGTRVQKQQVFVQQ